MQGGNDLLVGLISAAGNLGSGVVFAGFGYTIMAWISLGVTLIPIVMAFSFLVSRGRLQTVKSQ